MFFTRRHALMVALAMLPSLAGAQNRPIPPTPPAVPGAASASSGAAPSMVTFVLVPSLEVDTAGAIILRRATRAPQNIILVSPATTPADLVDALAILRRSRQSKGDSLAVDMKAIIQRGNDAAARRSRNYDVAVRNLERLKIALARPVAGVGQYPAVTVRLPQLRREGA